MLIAIAIFCVAVMEFLHLLNNYKRYKEVRETEKFLTNNSKEVISLRKTQHQAELAAMEDYWSHKTELLEKQNKDMYEALTNIKNTEVK